MQDHIKQQNTGKYEHPSEGQKRNSSIYKRKKDNYERAKYSHTRKPIHKSRSYNIFRFNRWELFFEQIGFVTIASNSTWQP